MYPMENIKILRDELRKLGWHITAFLFRYKSIEYIVLFENFDNIRGDNKLWPVILTFIDRSDPDRRLETKANAVRFEKAEEIRTFFRVADRENSGDFFSQFYSNFGKHIPRFPQKPDKEVKDLILTQLDRRDQADPAARNCFAVKRNGKRDGKQLIRSLFNANKTQLLRPTLYDHFKNDNTISFCYSTTQPDLPDTEIIARFAAKKDSSAF